MEADLQNVTQNSVSRFGSASWTGMPDPVLNCEPESGPSTLEKIILLIVITMFKPKQHHERHGKTLIVFDFNEKLTQDD